MRVLVLCTGNSCRSQMAEGFIRKALGDGHDVYSAGTEPHRVNPYAILVMAEAGIDISSHSSDHVGRYISDRFDYVITVCDKAAANCPVFPGPVTRFHWPFEDPAQAEGTEEEILGAFRRIRDEIGARVSEWVDSLERR